MKKQKGLRVVAFILVFCMVFHSGTIYATEGSAEWGTIAEAQTDTTTSDQDESALHALAETDEQGQTAESDLTVADMDAETPAVSETDPTQPETPAAEETLTEAATGSDENSSGTPENETGEIAAEETTEEPTEIGETVPEQEIVIGETASMTEPLSENGETESESDGIALMMGVNAIALEGAVAKDEDGNEYGSLQEAIDGVANDGTITLLMDITESVTVSNTKTFTIDLDSKTWTAKSGHALSIPTGVNVTVENGTINGTSSSEAAVILNGCTFTGENLTVQNASNTSSSGNGGGIYASGGNLTLRNHCVIANNSAYCGGGIYTKNTNVTINDCEIYGNNSPSGISPMGSGMYIEAGHIDAAGLEVHDNKNAKNNGGGFYAKTLDGTISNSDFYNNSAKNGGGIYTRTTEAGHVLTFDNVNIYQNTLNSNSGSGAGLYVSSALVYNTGSIRNNDCNDGNSALELANNGNVEDIVFNGVDIKDNTNVKYTIKAGSNSHTVFTGCNIVNNIATSTGGIRAEQGSEKLTLNDTTIKDNECKVCDSYSSGGLSVVLRANLALDFTESAIYENKITYEIPEGKKCTNDIYVGSRSTVTIPKASEMVDHGTPLTNYVWLDKLSGEKRDDEIKSTSSNTSIEYGYTAVEDVKRHVAKINGVEYTSIQDAIRYAGPDDVIELIIGDDDTMGDSYVCDEIIIDKPVKINFSGKTLAKENGKLNVFNVTRTGQLTLIGDGTISGNVYSEGTVILEGNVVATNYMHYGNLFKVDAMVDTINVSFGDSKFVTAGEKFNTNEINITPYNNYIVDFNDETSEETPDLLLIKNAGEFDKAKISLKSIKRYFAQILNDGGDIKLKKLLLKGVYVDGVKGIDTNSGLNSDYPVKTIDRAIEILNKNTEFNTIYVVNTVTIEKDTTIDIEGKYIKRFPSNEGHLFNVSGSASLTLDNVTINGMSEYFSADADSMIENSGTLTINEGTVLENNNCSRVDLSDYHNVSGGAVSSTGTLIMNGGTIRNCQAFNGGGVFLAGGTFDFRGGTITDCSVSGLLTGGVPAAGGGICLDASAQLIFNGGTVTKCESSSLGGGVSLGGHKFLENVLDSNESMTMNGGEISNCIAGSNGGGLYVQCSFNATINAGKIINNHSSSGNFGGGGIYVNGGRTGYRNGRLQLFNVVISDNTSKDKGGGIAGCNTSNTKIYLNSGGVIYNNKDEEKKDDIYLSDNNGAGVTTKAPDNYISDYMLGGTPYKWKRVSDGSDYGTNYLHKTYVKHLYTKAGIEYKEAIQTVLKKNITTFIQNNSSDTNGGGIGSNGDVIIGSDFSKDEAIDISVTKTWDDETYGPLRPDKIDVWLTRDGEDNTVSCVEIYPTEEGEWPITTFTNQPKYAPDGHVYKYGISEDITYLGNIYTPEIKETTKNNWTVTNKINCGRLEITKTVTEETEASGHQFEFTITLTDSEDNPVSGTFPINDREESITFENGVGTVELADGEKVIINDIPKDTKFEVLETKVDGYITYSALNNADPTIEQRTVEGTIAVQQTSTANFKNECSMDNEVTITKHTVDTEGHEYPITQDFKVALFDDEKLTNMVSEVKILRFNRSTSNTVTFDGLYYGKTYYVAELDSSNNPINGKTNYLSDGSSFTVEFLESNKFEATNKSEVTIDFNNVITENVVTSYLDLDMKKILEGRTPKTEDVYEFYIEALKGAPEPVETRFSISPDEIKGFDKTFGTITFTEAGTYNYLIKETKGSLNGVTYAADYYKIEITVKEYKTIDGETVFISDLTKVQYSNDNGETFEDFKEMTLPLTNVYHPAPITFAPQVKKTIDGDVPADNPKKFTFRIEPDSTYKGLEMPDSATVTVTGQDTGEFDDITFTEAGTYRFKISEDKGTDAGYTYSDEYYTLTVMVKDDLDGKLEIEEYSYSWEDTTNTRTDYAEFKNYYETTPVDFSLEVTKEITGEETPTKQTFDFNVELKDENHEGVILKDESASITGSGAAKLGSIRFTKAGTYTFQVYETHKSIPGYSMDGAVYDVVVKVVDEESQLVVDSVTYTKNGKSADKIVFTNTYSTTSVSYAPQIRKVITGDIPPVNKDFHFEIRNNNNSDGVTMPASTRAVVSGAGKASFGEITFTKAGTYTFEIREVKDAEHGYTYSNEVYTLTIEITDEDSVLKPHDITYQAAGSGDSSKELAEFENDYEEVPTSYEPLVVKEIDGEEPPTDKTFEFKIAGKEGDPEGYEIADDTVTINGHGSVNFKPITFKKVGTYSFEISETAGTENGYTYDTGKYTLEVKVIDDDSNLKIDEVKYYKGADEKEAAEFVNSYAVKSTAFQIPVEKALTGSETPDAKDFSFKLAGENVPGCVISDDSLKLTGAGDGLFKPITFTKAGIYTFTVSETAGTDKGYTYDDTVYTVTITVGDHDSQLQVDSVVYKVHDEETDAVVFTNDCTKPLARRLVPNT